MMRNINKNNNNVVKRKERKCAFCEEKMKYIDYKNFRRLMRFLSQYGKIQARYYTGVCLNHQKKLARAIKLARSMALLHYVRR